MSQSEETAKVEPEVTENAPPEPAEKSKERKNRKDKVKPLAKVLIGVHILFVLRKVAAFKSVRPCRLLFDGCRHL